MRLIDADVSIEKMKSLPIELDAETIQRCIEVLSNMPSADWDLPSIQAEHYAQGFADGYKRGMEDADRPSGKWIIQDNPKTGWYRVECSECDEDVTSNIPMIGFFPHCKPLWDFCPHCGADMRGGIE